MERKTWIIIIFLSSVFLISIIGLCAMKTVERFIIYQKTAIIPGTLAYKEWVEATVPVYTEFYFFNLTNPAKFLDGEKPIVKQVGPYTYREFRIKRELERHESTASVQYKQFIQYHFDRQRSVGNESDLVTNLNLGFLGVDEQFGWMPEWVDEVIELLANETNDHLVIRKSVKDLLWGYEDSFLNLLKTFGLPIPSTRIGLYLDKNNTAGDLTEEFSDNKKHNFHHIYKFQGKEKLSCWMTEQANAINGSDSTGYPLFMNPSDEPYIFASEICRSIQLEPVGMEDIRGIPAMKYLFREDTFKSPFTTEKNRGFCIDWPHCLKDNVFNVSNCIKGAPIVVSLPHLNHADPTYRDAVLGLKPSDDMNTTLYIELQTGTLVSGSKQIQINAIVRNNPKFQQLSKVKDVFLPIMYMNESMTIDEELAKTFKTFLITIPFVIKIGVSVMLSLSIVTLVVIGVHKYVQKHGIQISRSGYESLEAVT